MEAILISDLFKEFLEEGFEILNVSRDQRPSCNLGITIINDKENPLYIDLSRKKITLSPKIFELVSYGQDIPTPLRLLAYSTANRWKRALTTDKLTDKLFEDMITAFAIATIKGLQLFSDSQQTEVYFQVKNKVKELTGLNIIQRRGSIHGKIKNFISIDINESLLNFKDHIIELINNEKSTTKPLPNVIEGQLGSESNPFENIDEAANHILELEKERLTNDSFRNYICELQYFADLEHFCFRIPWASPYVSYQSTPNFKSNGFVINQLVSGKFNLKPCLYNHKFLFRGQSNFYSPCVPNIFRNQSEDYFLKYTIFTCEMELLLDSHPLVQLLKNGVEVFNDYFKFEINYGGLSQHYYNKTQFLDLTSSIEAAKFFAVTTFDFNSNRYLPYTGDKLGVLYYYDIEPDAFSINNKNRGYQLSTIGKQIFMRSGAQHGFLLAMEKGIDFNKLPQVRYVFFKHNPVITNRIYNMSRNGDIYQTDDILQHFWYNKINNPDENKSVCMEAVNLNKKHNQSTSKTKLMRRLREEGIKVHRNGVPQFSMDDLNKYYYDKALDFWKDFCSDIYFFSPEGRVLYKHFLNLPNNEQYKDYFTKH